MTRFCGRIGGLCLIIAAMIVMMMAGGKLLTTDRPTDLETCEGSPCVLGMTPGQTSWRMARESLDLSPLAQVSDKSIALKRSPLTQTDLFISVDALNVGRIRIRPTTLIQAGWLVENYGSPCGLSIYRQLGRFTGTVTLRYPMLLANIATTDLQLDTTDPITDVMLLDPAYHPKHQPNVCVDNVTDGARNFTWHGFASFHAYFANRALYQE